MAGGDDSIESLTPEQKENVEALIPEFKCTSLLNQDQSGRRLIFLGDIRGQQGLLILERAAFPTGFDAAAALKGSLTSVANLGANDIYHWYMASTGGHADAKLNLIWPSGPQHVKKYAPQTGRVVTETPEIFAKWVRPYMERKTRDGRLNWVYNILEGRQEQQNIILRSTTNLGFDPEGFLLLPDMNWDRKTPSSLRLLALVERRGLLSLRDLTKGDAPWLRRMWAALREAACSRFDIEPDQLKAYLHYQPTYYHMHVHIVSVALEPNATQAVGKAFSLPNLIAQLETMAGPDTVGMKDVDLTYTIGDGSELWDEVFGPLKEGSTPAVHAAGE